MIRFECDDIGAINWKTVEDIGEINIFQTLPWIRHLSQRQRAEPVLLTVHANADCVGYVTGLIANKFGLRMFGSPLRGWSSYFMGTNLSPAVSRNEVLRALPGYVFKELGCHYMEIVEPRLKPEELDGLPYQVTRLPWFSLNLCPSEEELFANMETSGRNSIRKALKSGVVVQEAKDLSFADEYYQQHTEVMQRQSLLPIYSLETLRNMLEELLPTGNMLLLRGGLPGGPCIATGIFLYKNDLGMFWGAASCREYQYFRPNEMIAWYGMRALKARGIRTLHFGGEAERYKRKLGCQDANLYRLTKAKDLILEKALCFVISRKILGLKTGWQECCKERESGTGFWRLLAAAKNPVPDLHLNVYNRI